MGSRPLQSGIPVEGAGAGEILETPFAQEMFMNGFSFEPFINEVGRIKHLVKCLELNNEDKKLKVRSQYEQDIENTRRKYDLLLKIEDEAYKKEKALLQEYGQKVERGLVQGQLSNSNLGQTPPIYQVETLRIGSTLGPAPGRNLTSAIAQPTGTGGQVIS